MKTNPELRAEARAQLKGNWGGAVLICFIYFLIVSGPSVFLQLLDYDWQGSIIAFVLGGPLAFGITGYFLKRARSQKAKLENLFDGFKVFGSTFLLLLLQTIFTVLWALLLIVPGIIKALAYSMSYYILVDNPEIGAMEAITRSKNMMKGHKWRFFCLNLGFLGWGLLCLLTLGIGYLWLSPYMYQSITNFYEDLKQGASQAETAPTLEVPPSQSEGDTAAAS